MSSCLEYLGHLFFLSVYIFKRLKLLHKVPYKAVRDTSLTSKTIRFALAVFHLFKIVDSPILTVNNTPSTFNLSYYFK